MTSITFKTLVLVVLAAYLGRLAVRLADWTIPEHLNYRLAAVVARIALRLAVTEAQRDEAADALANVLARGDHGSVISNPLSAVCPVAGRCVLAYSLGEGKAWCLFAMGTITAFGAPFLVIQAAIFHGRSQVSAAQVGVAGDVVSLLCGLGLFIGAPLAVISLYKYCQRLRPVA